MAGGRGGAARPLTNPQIAAARGIEFTHAPHMIHRHEDRTEEWMAFFADNEGRPLALMVQVEGQASRQSR